MPEVFEGPVYVIDKVQKKGKDHFMVREIEKYVPYIEDKTGLGIFMFDWDARRIARAAYWKANKSDKENQKKDTE